MTAQQQAKKLSDNQLLIEDIIRTIYPDRTIENIIHEDNWSTSFTMPINAGLGRRFVLTWDRNLDFDIGYMFRGEWRVYHPRTSVWFTVARMLNERHIAARKLKKAN